MHQPATAALLEPAELKGVCAETAASPVAAATPAMQQFLAAYRAAYNSDPDAYAAAQYDAVRMLGDVIGGLRRDGATVTPASVREKLATSRYRGVVTTYWSDGRGDMAHDAEIVCFDGTDRVPKPVARYSLPPR
jgi:branched-chain amino acid transport system substrate-binding protein